MPTVTTTTTTTTTATGVTHTFTRTDVTPDEAVPPAAAAAAVPAHAEPADGALPGSKDDITAEWLTVVLHSHGSLPASVQVVSADVTYLKGEDDKAAGGVAQAMAGGMLLKVVPTYSDGAATETLPHSLVAKATFRIADVETGDISATYIDAQEAWAYNSGTSQKIPGACECYFAGQGTTADGVGAFVLLLEDLSANYEDRGGGLAGFHRLLTGEYPAAQLTAVVTSAAQLHAATAGCDPPQTYGPPSQYFADGATLKRAEAHQPTAPESNAAGLYQGSNVGFPHGGVFEACVAERMQPGVMAVLLARQEQTGVMQRIVCPPLKDRACPNTPAEVQKAAETLLLASDWDARIKSKLPDSFPDPPPIAEDVYSADALAACSEEGKAVAAIILGRAETIGYWPPGFQEYFAVMLKQETGWKQMVVQQVKHHCESSMTEEDENTFVEALLDPDLSLYSCAWQKDPEVVKLMHGLDENWQRWLASDSGQAQQERMFKTTMCTNHGDLHFGNVMWSDELQSLKLFDLQFTGKAPAVCDIAYLLGPSMGARDSDYNRRFVTAIKQYTAAISAAGVDYAFEDVCQDMAWMLLQQLIHFMCDSPVNLAAGEYQGDEKSLFTGVCQVKFNTALFTNGGTAGWNKIVYAFFKGAEAGLTQEQFNATMRPRIFDYTAAAIYLLTSEDCAAGSEMAKAIYT